MSCSVRSILSPMLLPLLRIERCVRQAAFGEDVVPEVNWILMMSSGWSVLLRDNWDSPFLSRESKDIEDLTSFMIWWSSERFTKIN